MKKILLLILFLPTLSNAAVFTDAQLLAALAVPSNTYGLTCAKSAYHTYPGATNYASNATFGYVAGSNGLPSFYHAQNNGYLANVRVGFSPTTTIGNVTLANGSVVRKSTGGGAISMLKGVNIYENGVLQVHLPVITMWGTATSNYRLSNGQIQAYSANTGITGVTTQFVGYYSRDNSNQLIFDYGYLKVSKAGKNYFLTCYHALY